MRLDLVRHNCVEFFTSSQFTVPAEDDFAIQSLMMETGHRVDDSDGSTDSFYGSKFKIRGSTHGSRVTLSRRLGGGVAEYLVTTYCSLEPDDLPRPPREIRSVAKFFDALPSLIGELEFGCRATFVHDLQDGKGSRVTLPMPLLLMDSGGLTHIEAVRLSHREADNTTYSIEIEPLGDSDSVVHIVEYTVGSDLTPTSIRMMLELAARISASLITDPS